MSRGEAAFTDNLPAVADPVGIGMCSAQGAQIGHGAFPPEKRVCRSVGSGTPAHDLPPAVDRPGIAVGTAQGSQIGQNSLLPEKGMRVSRSGVTVPDHLSPLVDATGIACESPQGAQVDHVGVRRRAWRRRGDERGWQGRLRGARIRSRAFLRQGGGDDGL